MRVLVGPALLARSPCEVLEIWLGTRGALADQGCRAKRVRRTAFSTYSGRLGIRLLPRTRSGPTSTPGETADDPVAQAFKKQIEIRGILGVLVVAAVVCHEFVNRKDSPRCPDLARPRERAGDPCEEPVSEVAKVRQPTMPLRQ